MRNEGGCTQIDVAIREFLDGISDYGNVKDRICFRLINTGRNRDFLDTVPHRDFLDLSAAYYVCFEMADGRFTNVAVTTRMADAWGVEEKELWEAAFVNTQRILPADVGYIQDVVAELADVFGEDGEGTAESGKQMVVATNQKKWHGAGSIFYDDVLTRLTDILGRKIFLLPSSVHEFLAVADDGMTDPGFLAGMVRSINTGMLPDNEFLSDNVYRYEKGGEITIAV